MLTLQFGQCGNQLGYDFYSLINKDIQTRTSISNDYVERSTSTWFQESDKSGKQYVRAILIDTEKKVINQIIRNNNDDDKWCYRSKNVIIRGDCGGSANNWAYGFFKRGPQFEESILEVVRTELERADKLDGYICLLTCAGGTGSGLGSYMIKTLRHEFPTKSIVGVIVFPFLFGEVVVQNYNIVLSLDQIIDNSDLIICLENEKLKKELNRKFLGLSKLYEINYPYDLNNIACQKLLSIFQPASDGDGKYNTINNLISKLVPHPAYKITTIESKAVNLNFTNSTAFSWLSQYKHLRRSLLIKYYDKTNSIDLISKSLANVLITRGSTEHRIKNSLKPDLDNFKNHLELNNSDVYSQMKWLTPEERFSHFHQERPLFNYDKLATIITNNSYIYNTLDDIVNKAKNVYTYGAYLHQYKKFGLENDDFLKAFAKVEACIASYKALEKY